MIIKHYVMVNPLKFRVCQNIKNLQFLGIIMSKLSNNLWWSLTGWIIILAGLMIYVQGYKPILFGIGILIVFYRIVMAPAEKYDTKITH